jgi:flagella basal body P-ring formation protein FlgA
MELDALLFIWGYRATEDLPAGASLREDVVRRVPVRAQPGVIDSDIRFYVASDAVRAGSVLVTSSLRKAPLVRVGDEVDLEVRRGSVQVRLNGASKSEGGIGDAVFVRIGLTGRLVTGIVSDWRTVYVEFD